MQVTTLLLHQHRVTEALAQLQRHVELFRRPPPGVPPGYAAWHFSWVTRQYKVVGELLGGRVNPANLPAQVCSPEDCIQNTSKCVPSSMKGVGGMGAGYGMPSCVATRQQSSPTDPTTNPFMLAPPR